VLGIDFAPNAVDQARANAAAKGIDARFEVADAMMLDSEPSYDTVIDSALFHIFGDAADRARYVASLHRAIRPGGVLHLLALSDAGRGFRSGGQRGAGPRGIRRRVGARGPRHHTVPRDRR